jgi:2-polyprenyl-6-methoxyphenol hydroxylase-like FAD-dependent oxidoreductase
MRIVIVGSGICGLGAALLLARDGHEVTVLERDADPLPPTAGEAWDSWPRKGVAQFHQPHNFMPGLRLLLEAELPDMQPALAAAGASRFDFINPLPPFITDRSPRPIDEQLWTLTARRPAGEWVFANAVRREPRITVRRGASVAGLVTGTAVLDGTPHIVGVRTGDGEEIRADLVVDASGRQSRSPQWLEAVGGRAPYEEHADSGFTYYTRYFSGPVPERRAGTLMHLGSMSLLTLPGDNGTYSVTIFTGTGDQPLKNLRHEDRWTRVLQACPLHAHWLNGEPITDVLAMSGVVDRYRRFVVDGAPVATGFAAVADAWACTNPSAGRGLTVGFKHARVLRDVLRDTAGDPRTFVEEFDRRTEADVAPWYHAQIAMDRARHADLEAIREGRAPAPPSDPLARSIMGLMMSMAASADLFRLALEYVATITPAQEILRRPGVADAIQGATTAMRGMPPPPMPAPNRAQLLELVS